MSRKLAALLDVTYDGLGGPDEGGQTPWR